MDNLLDEFNRTAVYKSTTTPDNRLEVESTRFRNDCRKRSLDLAHNSLSKEYTSMAIPDDEIFFKAELYYAWLLGDYDRVSELSKLKKSKS